jgi:hypothetical protein
LTLQTASEAWRQRTALSHTKARAASRQLVLAELGRRPGLLRPEAAEVLADRWSPMFDNARPEVVADYISRHLADEEVVRLSSDSGQPPNLARRPDTTASMRSTAATGVNPFDELVGSPRRSRLG